jgi:hypothetical protein
MALSEKARKRLEVALANRKDAKEVADAIDVQAQAAAVADIPTPATATAEDAAEKINELMQSMRDAGLLA